MKILFRSQKYYFVVAILQKRAKGLCYLRVGGRKFCLGAGKTRSQKNV